MGSYKRKKLWVDLQVGNLRSEAPRKRKGTRYGEDMGRTFQGSRDIREALSEFMGVTERNGEKRDEEPTAVGYILCLRCS